MCFNWSSVWWALKRNNSNMSIARPIRTIVRHLQTTSACREVFQLNDKAQFTEKVITSKKPVVIDFHANWCGPCHELGPRLEAAAEKAGLDLIKVNIDDHSELAMEYDVTAVPAVVGVSEGKVINKFIGAQADSEITKFIQKLINSTN